LNKSQSLAHERLLAGEVVSACACSPASSPSHDGKEESPSPAPSSLCRCGRAGAVLRSSVRGRTPHRRLTTPISMAIAGASKAKGAEKHGGALRQQPLRGGGREPFLGTRAHPPPLWRRSSFLTWHRFSSENQWGIRYFAPVWIWTGRRTDHVPAMEKQMHITPLQYRRRC